MVYGFFFHFFITYTVKIAAILVFIRIDIPLTAVEFTFGLVISPDRLECSLENVQPPHLEARAAASS